MSSALADLDKFITENALKYYNPIYRKVSDFLALSLVIIWFLKENSPIKVFIDFLIIASLWLLSEFGIKTFIKRERPIVVYDLDKINSFSFPSTHSLISAYVAMKLHPIFLLVAFTIGVLRVLTLMHWFSDILGGILLGIFFSFLI